MKNWEGKELQMVSFASPYPPDYGGVIDVFYKIKTLTALGVKIHLHTYAYDQHQPSPVLNQYCASVQYYPRSINSKYLQGMPYIVSSRFNKSLINNVLSKNIPVLLEGLHTAFLLPFLREKNIVHALRLHNVEWLYYRLLAESELSLVKRRYFIEESRRLKDYEQILNKATLITLSARDTKYAEHNFSASKVLEVLPFHEFEGLDVLNGKGDYAIFHGNLSVNENEKAALWLVNEVFSKINFPLVIAGKNPSEKLQRACNVYNHIKLINSPENVKMKALLQNAHVHLLPNSQPTGMKLKWVHALQTARFIVAHPDIAQGFEGKAGIYSALDAKTYIQNITNIQQHIFDSAERTERKEIMGKSWDNVENAEALLKTLIF